MNPQVSATSALRLAESVSEAFSEAYSAVLRGWGVIPCQANKKPDGVLLRQATGKTGWAEFQSREPSLREFYAWSAAPAFGLVTGFNSGVVVLDVDPRGFDSLKGLHLPETVTARTPRGFHYLFQHPGVRVKSINKLLPDVDVKGDGGYVLLPGPEGREWVMSPDDVTLAPMPEWLLELTADSRPIELRAPKRAKQTQKPLALEAEKPLPLNSPTPLGPVTGDRITAWFRNPEVALQAARHLGIGTDALGKGFHDVLPGPQDKNPSASLYQHKNGLILYRSFRAEQQWYTLSDVMASQAYGTAHKLVDFDADGRIKRVRPECTAWTLRLLVEMGVMAPATVKAKTLPNDVRPAVRKVYEGFLLLLGCKWLHTPGAPSPFTWRFACAWCGIKGQQHVGEAMKWLLQHGYLVQADTCKVRGKDCALFLPR